MRREEVASMVKSMGLPFAYYQFEEGSGQQPPFIVFFYEEEGGIKADDRNYVKTATLVLEFYSDYKDFDTEDKIEAVLDAYDAVYTKYEEYISSERMFKIEYTMEVIIDGSKQG